MKNPFFPDERYHRITDIEPASLLAQGLRGVILDVDNTLTTHDNPVPGDGVMQWLQTAQAAGLSLIILSNNHPERVETFAKRLNLPFEADGKKPLPGGFLRACAHMKLPKHQVCAIGDQIFTDVMGAKLAGILCLMVDPIELESTWFFHAKRRLEQPILRSFERRKRQ